MQISFLKVEHPIDTIVSSARSCYSPNGIILPQDSTTWKNKINLLDSIFKAGHHTTLQHINITMLISGISRHLVYRFLHSHTHYNSEQVSQRYAKMQIQNFLYPPVPNTILWQNFYEDCFKSYEKLINILQIDIEKLLPKFKQKESIKKAQEFARYLLPQGTTTYLYHSVNIITILRYIVSAKALIEVNSEAMEFAKLLEKNLLQLDSNFQILIDYAKNEEIKYPKIDIEKIKKEQNISNESLKVFDIVKPMSFDVNANYSGILRGSQMLLDGSNMGSFNSYIKLSLSADAQNQRHRKSIAIRDLCKFEVDYYTPEIIQNNKEALEIYNNMNLRSYEFIESQRGLVDDGDLVYALLNSHNVEIIEHNDFNSFLHKAQMRLCYNAQEEIFNIIKAQIETLREAKVPNIESYMPPCHLRAKERLNPICPEGNRFCGEKVWKLDFNELRREI